MTTGTFSSLLGQGMNTLASAIVPNSSRQLLGLKAQNLGTRNLANALLAQQRQFDLAQDTAQAKRLNEEIARRTQGSQITDGMNPEQINQANRLKQSLGAFAMNPTTPLNQIKADNQLLENADYWNSMGRMRQANPMVQLPDVMGQDGKMVQQKPLSAVDLLATGTPYSGLASGSTAPFVASKNIAQTEGYQQDNNAITSLQQSLATQFPDGIPYYDRQGKTNYVPTNSITSPSQLTDLNIDLATIKKVVAQTRKFNAGTENIENDTTQDKQKFPKEMQILGSKVKKARYDWKGAKYKMQEAKVDAWLAKNTRDFKFTQEEAKAKKLKYEAILKKFESEGKITNFQFLGDGQAVGFKQNAKTGETEVVSIDMKGTPKIVKDWKKVKQVKDGKEVEVLVSPSLKQQIVMKQSENGEETYGVEAYKEEGKLIVGNTFNNKMNMTNKQEKELKDVIGWTKGMMRILEKNPKVAGGRGWLERMKELPKSYKGGTDIEATNFNTALRYLNFAVTPLLAQEKKFTDQEREAVKKAIGGDSLLDLAGKTKGGMQFLITLLESKAEGKSIKFNDIMSIIEGAKNPGILQQGQFEYQNRTRPTVSGLIQNPTTSAMFQDPNIQGAFQHYGDKLRIDPKSGAFFVVVNGKAKNIDLGNKQILRITDKAHLKTLQGLNK